MPKVIWLICRKEGSKTRLFVTGLVTYGDFVGALQTVIGVERDIQLDLSEAIRQLDDGHARLVQHLHGRRLRYVTLNQPPLQGP